jgi:hypothetical protein
MTVNMLGIQEDQDSRRTAAAWLWSLLPIGIAVFCISALIYYHLYHDEIVVASALQALVATGYRWLGFAPAFIFCLLLLTWSSIWFVTGRIERPAGRLARLAAMTVMLGVFMNIGEGGVTPAFHKGELGYWLAERLVAAAGYYPSLVLVWGVTFGSLLLATDFFFSEAFERLRGSAVVEAGVETEVTDHLKGLGSTSSPESAAAIKTADTERSLQGRLDAALEDANALVESDADADADLDVGADTVGADVVVEPAVEDAVEPPAYTPRRRSYFERRYMASSDSEASPPSEEIPVPEAWMPMAPEAQEIENPETSLETSLELSAPLSSPNGRDTVSAPDEPAPVDVPLASAEEHDAPFEAGGWSETEPVADESLAFAPTVEESSEREVPEAEAPLEPADEAESAVEERDSQARDTDASEDAGEAPSDGLLVDGGVQEPIVWLEPPAVAQVPLDQPEEPVDEEQIVEAREAAAEEGAEKSAAASAGAEPVVSIPRPEPGQVEANTDAHREPVRQQRLFGAGLDEALVSEAVETVTTWRRASATFLQRKLRIDYEQACQLMVELSARGVVELEEDASHGRVLG